MNKIFTYCYITVIISTCFASFTVSAQNMGFEAPAATPPTGWVPVTLVWSHNTDPTYVRTGGNSMQVTDPATTGSTIGSTNGFVTTAGGNYLITIAWGKSNTAANASFYLGYRLGATNTLNPSTTTTPPAQYVLNNSTWTRISSASAATVVSGTYGPALRAFRQTSTTGTVVYMDDFMIYESVSNVPDLTAPNPVTGANIAGNFLSWTNGTDNGAPASGISGVVIVRADGVSLPAPTLNNQAMYNPVNSTAGTGSFIDGGNTWTVVANIAGNATTTFTDGSAGGGPYTYAIYMRDMGYNYSSGTAVTVSSPCIEPPVPGTFNPSPATPVCSGAPVTLGLQGGTSGIGQTYQWQSSPTIGGTYTNISGVLSSPSFIINPTSTLYYKCEIICSGGAPVYSTPGQVVINPAFSGTYTINSAIGTGGTNFQTFAAAVAAMSACGINGPVVFNVDAASGPYTEQITIPVLNGSSASNTVTFNGNGRTLQFTPVTAARHILKLDGADYVTFNNLNIVGLATDFDWGVHLTNVADHNTFNNCTIDLSANTSTAQSNSGGIVASNSTTVVTTTGNNASYLTVSGCTIIGGYQGIILNGLATGLNAINNTISNNIIREMYGNGIELVQNDGALVSGNNISRATRTTMLSAAAGIEIGPGSKNVTVNANKIHDTHTSVITQTGTAYGIYFNSCDAPLGSENRVTNNLIYNFNSGSGTQYGLYNSGSDGVFYYHNTVVLDNAASTAGTTYAFYQITLASGIQIKNNIFYVTRGGSGTKNCLRFGTTTSTIISNNNVLYMNAAAGTNGIGYYGVNFVTLTDWKGANSNAYDQQSVDHNPSFTGVDNFIPTNPLVDNIGANVGVATDITGSSRTLSSPDPGAYEWSSGVDLVPPAINYALLPSNSSTANRTLVATITDLGGVQTGTNGPRLYYKKSTDPTYVFDNNPLIVGDNYTFTINYAAIGGVTPGTTIQYYVAAQDLSANVATNPAGGSGINPPGTIAPPSPNSYLIIPVIAGTYLIGTGETYEKLTNLANALNNKLVEIGGNVTFEFTNNYDGTTGETLPINFNEFSTTNSSWTVTVRPGAGVTNRITSGDPGSGVGVSVINFTGGDRYIFDGRPGGTGSVNEWTIRNTRSATTIGSVIRFVDDATYNVIRNLNIESQATSTTTGAIFLNTSTGTLGNSFNSFLSNNIRGISGLSISNGFYSSGTALVPNSDIAITNNNIYDFGSSGISIVATGNGPNWVISNNNIFNTTSSALTQNGISIASVNATNTTISGNFIGGNAPGATGTWMNTGNVVVQGIALTGGIANISNNTISNITNTGTGTTARVRGILHTSAIDGVVISNNQISNLSSTGAVTGVAANAQVAVGISIFPGSTFYTVTANGNIIDNISAENTSALSTYNMAAGVFLTNFTGEFSKNTIRNIKNKGTGTTAGQPPLAVGIYARFMGTGNVVNNMISLGSTESTNTQFAGIMVTGISTGGNFHKYYYNSILVSGASSGSIPSYGFVRGEDSTTTALQVMDLKNNIISMLRTGPGAINYAIATKGPFAGSNWASNYNDLHNADPTAIGIWNATGYDFAGWQTASGGDANSVSLQPFFISATDLHLDPLNIGNQGLDNLGTPISGITVDFDNQTRNLTTPDMGADEFTYGVVVPVTIEFFRGAKQTSGNLLDWKVSCTSTPYATLTLERSADGRSFTGINSQQATSLRCQSPFSYVDAAPLPGINYYRLKMTDADGKTTYSHLVVIINKEKGFEIVGLNPNPVYNVANLNLSTATSAKIEIIITDINGRLMQKQSAQLQSGSNLVPLKVATLAPGSYQVTVINEDGEKTSIRFVKQ